MSRQKDTTFDAAAFLANAGLGRRIIQIKPKQDFFLREVPQMPSFIFRRAARSLLSFQRKGKKPPSRFSPLATSLERSQSPEWPGFDWRLPLRLASVQR
jgi:hypothetical protein